MDIPTYTEELGEDLLGPSISVIHGREIFNDVSIDDPSISLEEINAQLRDSSDPIEFLPASPMEDEPFEVFKRNSQKAVKEMQRT